MATIAVLPVKSFGRAKQRLHEGMPARWRRELAEAMVADVLRALSAVRGLDRVIVVTGYFAAFKLAQAAGAAIVHDPEEAGQSAAALLGVEAAEEAQRVLLVPGDCPALVPAEVEGLLAGPSAARSVTIVPDRHGQGTNALLIRPPEALVPAFGPGSFARHAARARAAGAEVKVASLPSLTLDVDTPDDLEALRAALARRPGTAPRTGALLERLAAAAA